MKLNRLKISNCSRVADVDIEVCDESQPLVVEAALGNLNDDELAAFPDEVDALNGNELVVKLEAFADEDEISIVRVSPNGSTHKTPSKTQKEAFGWTFLQAQSGLRDIRQGHRSIVDDAISEIDLGADESAALGMRCRRPRIPTPSTCAGSWLSSSSTASVREAP